MDKALSRLSAVYSGLWAWSGSYNAAISRSRGGLTPFSTAFSFLYFLFNTFLHLGTQQVTTFFQKN